MDAAGKIQKLSLVSVAAAAGLVLAACGSSGGGTPAGNSSPPPVTDSSLSSVPTTTAPSATDSGAPSTQSSAPSSESSSSQSSSSQSSGTTVDVKDYKFTPSTITIKKGQKVTWKFGDDTAHNVTADDKSFASDNISNGGTYSHVFNTAGSYSYVCTIHPYMKGTVKVTG